MGNTSSNSLIWPSNTLLREITEMALIGYMIYLVEGKADRENNPTGNGIDGFGALAGDGNRST